MNCLTLSLSRAESFQALEAGWNTLLPQCHCQTIFLTWDWQELWWRTSGEGELHLLTIHRGDELVGIAPLIRTTTGWGFAGGVEVADFLDVIAAPEHAEEVAASVAEYLDRTGEPVDFRNLRPDSLGAGSLFSLLQRRGVPVSLDQEDVSPRIELPSDWETYLQGLTKKDRHELRRKIRRLQGAGKVWYGVASDPATRERDVEDFIRLHRLSAENKASFMTPAMQRFFHALVDEFGPRGWLRLYFLEIDEVRVASVILFDFGDEYLLYNSGYDPAYAHLSVGLLLKALCLRDAIAEGRKVFDFLQGNEPYKYDLGAHDVPILRLQWPVSEARDPKGSVINV